MEMRTIKKKPERRKLRYYSVPGDPRKQAVKAKEFFFIGNNKKLISLLLSNFESGFCSEDLQKGSQVLDMLITRKISLPDVIIIQDTFDAEDLTSFFLKLQSKIQSIPIIIEGSNTSANELQQFKKSSFVDDVFVLNDTNVHQFIKKIGFLKKIKASMREKSNVIFEFLPAEEQIASFGKKLFDIVVSVLAMVVLSPVFLIIAAIIKLESRGPVFYCSPRVGRGYKVFKFYKFRTMIMGADTKVNDLYHLNQYNTVCDKKSPMFFKVTNDPRVTKVGRFLRNTSLDELPQFFNVLKGDMSIVGNRPLPLYEAETLTTDEWAKRFLAPAGITGLWQIRKKANKNMSIEERIHLDINYADKHNFAYDMWILANTPTALLQKEEPL
ncbi:MAG TPA: sugar transferase [Flavitalea sp.]|nr:sugar transferase [Flavitalea sp.]